MRRKTLQPISIDTKPAQRQQILAEIAQLDDDFENGMINEESYHQLRAAKKAEVVRLMQRAKEEKTRP